MKRLIHRSISPLIDHLGQRSIKASTESLSLSNQIMETIPEKAMNSIQPGLAHYAAPHYMQFWVQEADFLGRTPKDFR